MARYVSRTHDEFRKSTEKMGDEEKKLRKQQDANANDERNRSKQLYHPIDR